MERKTGIASVLKNSDFLKLWVGQIISYVGDRIAQMALLGWLIASHQKTGSEMAKITFLIAFPSFLFGQLAGALSDKFPRKWIMVLSDFARALLVFLMALFIVQKISSPYLIYGIIFLIGTCTALFYPAKLAAIPSLVSAEELQAANALTSGTGVIATLIGTYLAGILIESWGPRTGLLINGLTYAVSGLAILWIRPNLKADSNSTAPLLLDFKLVWQYLKKHERTWRWILLSCVLSLLSSFFYISLTALAVDHFKLGTEGIGKLLTMLGVGMIVGSIAAVWLKRWLKANSLVILSFFIIFLTTATAPLVTSFSKAWVWLTLLGAANAIISITVDTLLQRATPNRFRGKVFGFRSVLTNGVFLLSLLAVSQLLKIASPFSVFKILAFVSLTLALLILLVDTGFSYQVGRSLIRMLLRLFFSFEVEGEEHLKYQSKVIVAGNHTGFLDIPILVAAFNRPIRFLAAQGVLNWPVIGLIVRFVGVMPVVKGRGDKNLASAIEELKRGKVVGIFPEGELSRDGKIGPFRRGVARLQTESNAPIIPFVIHGGYEAWPWGRWLPKPRKIILQFGQPIPRQNKDEKELVKDIRHRIEFMKSALERRERAKKDKAYQESVLSLLQSKSDVYGARTALYLKDELHWKELTYSELSRKARTLASYLIERGIQQGDRVAILSESRPEWGIALFGAIRAGVIFVPLDIKLTSAELVSILSDAEPRMLFISNQFLETAKALKTLLPCLEEIVLLDGEKNAYGFLSLDAIKPTGILKGRERRLEETALIIYTSGTTGNPKGVMTTFGNLIFEVKNFEELMRLGPTDMFLSILPLNHLLELTGGFLGVLHAGGRICYSQSLHPQEIAKMMREKKITYMVAVPLFLKVLKGSIEKEIRRMPSFQQNFFNFMVRVAKFTPRSVRKLIFYDIHEKFGGKLRGFIAGGAPLEIEVGEFFDSIGIPVYQGYGLTETSPVITVNTPHYNRIGSVGQPLTGVEVRIQSQDAEGGEGEILTRGPHVMKGYYKREDQTHEVIDEEGWFHTGDLGRMDKDGFLYITGRIRNLIVLGSGKKVHPEEVEAALSQSDLIKELCVVGRKTTEGRKEGQEEVVAVVVPSDSLKKNESQFIEAEIKKEIGKLSQNLASYKRASRIFVHLEDLPKTATRKVKRPLILKWLDGQDYPSNQEKISSESKNE